MTNAEKLVDSYYRAFNERDWAAYEKLFAADVQGWAPGVETVRGAQALRDVDKSWAGAFRDARITSVRKFSDGSAFVVSENRFSGTHTAELPTPQGEIAPTGKSVDVRYITIFEIEGGRLKAQRIYYDRLELLSQLGLEAAAAG